MICLACGASGRALRNQMRIQGIVEFFCTPGSNSVIIRQYKYNCLEIRTKNRARFRLIWSFPFISQWAAGEHG